MLMYVKKVGTILSLLFGMLFTLPVWAAVYGQINFQGYLTGTGEPVENKDYTMAFAIYDVVSGGTPLWSEVQTVTVANGVYNVILGQPGNEIDPVDIDGERFLGISVESDAEMTPRQPITATAFALRAALADDADSLAGHALTDLDDHFVQQGQTAAVDSDMISDGSIIDTDLSDGAVLAEILDDDGPGSNLNADLLDGQHASAFAGSSHNHDLDYLNVTGDSMSVSTGATGITVSNMGSGYGIEGRAAGDIGRGLVGRATATGEVTNYGVYAESAGDAGIALYGWATASGDAQNYGVYGYASGDDGRGLYGFSAGDHGVGVRGESSGLYARAVEGHASEGGDATNYGGYFQSDGNSGRGVYGYATGSDGRGVYGHSNTGTAGYFYSESGHGLIIGNGDVGIGTTDPDSNVSILGDSYQDVEMDITSKETGYKATLKLCEGEGCEAGMYWQYNGTNNQMRLYGLELGINYGPHITVNRETGRVGIGTDSPTQALTVNGKILAEEIEVVASIADYVFEDNYSRMSLEELERYIEKHHHLPGIASEKEVKQRGGMIPIGESYTQLLEKVEELTLYVIEQNKKIKELQDVIDMKMAGN